MFLRRLLTSVAALAVVSGLYAPVDAWFRRREPAYAELPLCKRLYCVKNRIKAGMLACATPFALVVLFEAARRERFTFPELMAAAGAMYAANDVVALVRVPRLPLTTVLHHLSVGFFAAASLVHDFDDRGSPFTHMVVLAAFSCLPFHVNLYLSTRHLRADRRLARRALGVYAPVFAANVLYHAAALRATRTWTAGLVVYHALLLLVFRDDVVLLRYLWRRAW